VIRGVVERARLGAQLVQVPGDGNGEEREDRDRCLDGQPARQLEVPPELAQQEQE
jgi:hypothetical protein